VNHPIRFGTSGWRGVLTDDITLPRARVFVRGLARWWNEAGPHGGRPSGGGPARILVAHDTRFLGRELAGLACRELAAAGHDPVPAISPVPTPVVAHAVRHGMAHGAIVFTASHNPAEYQGAKVIARCGGSVTDDQAQRIEAQVRRAAALGPPTARVRAGGSAADSIDLVGPYLARLVAWVDGDAFRHAPPAVVYDALHGTGAGVGDRALQALGVRVDVLRGARSARFGGGPPDPRGSRLTELVACVRARGGKALGLATDGDADRYAVVDLDGTLLSETEALALLVDRLARTGRVQRGVAISIATGSLVTRVAADYGLPVTRFPIGFKHLANALATGVADVAGEESGGFAVEALAREKDGILACVLFAEMVAAERAPLSIRLRELMRRHGPSACGRTALPADARVLERMARLSAAPPERVAGDAVRDVERVDGLRFALADGFVMLRVSGTEPLLRVYAEARDRQSLARRLSAGRALLSVDGVAAAD
jgi:phosphoglucomutase